MMRWRVLDQLGGTGVSLAEAKDHLRVLHDFEDSYIQSLISAATQYAENETGRAISRKRYLITAARLADNAQLPLLTIDEIESVTIDGEALASFSFIEAEPQLLCVEWPTTLDKPDSIKITVTAGYCSLPAPLKAAILMTVAHWYAHRENVTHGQLLEVPRSTEALLFPYRDMRLI